MYDNERLKIVVKVCSLVYMAYTK